MKPATGYMVYLLIDPRDLRPFYVGATCRPTARWSAHHQRQSSAYERIAELRQLGLKLRVRIMATKLALRDAQEREIQLIARYGATLVNKLHYRDRVLKQAAE